MREILEAICFLTGSAFIFIAAFGVQRLPDVYCRIHALAKANCLGVSLLLLGLWLSVDTHEGDFRILLAIFFQLLLIPISGHLVALLSAHLNLPRWRARPVRSLDSESNMPHGTPKDSSDSR